MKRKAMVFRTILLRILACILSILSGVLLWNGSIFSASASELGDVDGDGSITVQDACWILETYAKISAGIPTDVPSDLKSTADVDGDGMISVQDAVMVLQYYAKQAAGIPVSWNILKMSQVEQDAWTRSQETLQLINEQRAANGLSNLTTSDKLYEASSVRAKEIADTFSHTRPNGDSAFTVLDSMDIFFMCAGENIAMGFPTPKSVVTGWMNSPGHRANILGADYTAAAVGVYLAPDGYYYWSIFFIG